ncbi:epoxide hydrolase family protein [Chryseobacterium sp. PTM-20240506]|uniref:epoxide hydrolase family protein n=1 Tax=unclassified Chryseobacterium TaxID=2593645 RepID=UPI0023593BAC|nr:MULTISPECIES: epoxide hydrolase [unclassified Chryseobacterium]MDC8103622.1 epoxide hydrolase 1 [Chryseobacterium sp. B21-037]MDQ1803227.1 epoxide hydrolase [Chryseobacterium sp. CKR4-1]
METKANNLKTTITAGVFMLLSATSFAQNTTKETETIRPYHVRIPKTAIKELRQRINATRWPGKETVTDQSQGVRLNQIQDLVKYWGNSYDWHKAENKLNAYPQYITKIDGLDIHFIHVRSKYKNAMPLIITHGWPGSVFEELKAIEPLTDPVKYGGKAEDAFDVIIPSMPGYGFSEKPKTTGWDVERIGKSWDVLMKRLGYHHYVAQGGDWGAVIADAMGRQAPEGLLGIHVNMPATVPAEIADILKAGGPAPESLSEKEKAAFASLNKLYTRGGGYAAMMVTRPQTLGYGLTDSPAGLASFFLDKFNEWTYSGGNAEKSLTKDEMLDDISLYWFTDTAVSSAQLYWENNNNNFNVVEQKTRDIKVPVAITVFPGEIYQAPKTWAEKAYPNLMYFNEVTKGGHFASWEEPQIFAQELRSAFKPLRK